MRIVFQGFDEDLFGGYVLAVFEIALPDEIGFGEDFGASNAEVSGFFPKALPPRDGVTAVPWVFFVVEEGLEVVGNVVERVQLACKAAVEDADEAAGFEECGQIG